MHILITGAAGSLASQLGKRLLSDGHVVHAIARGSSAYSAEQRVTAAIGIEQTLASNLSVLDGDVTQESCGLPDKVIEGMHGKVDIVVHAAAFLKYAWRYEETATLVNVTGTRNVLTLANRLAARRFLHVSTAYVAGSRTPFGEEQIGHIDEAQNAYEKTKMLAEREVIGWREGKWAIARPSTIIGDSKTGKAAAFTGFYGFIKPVWQQRETLRRFREQPLSIPVNPTSTLNLVPMDWVIDMMTALTTTDTEGTYHLTHPKAVNMQWLFETSCGQLSLPVLHHPVSAPGDTSARSQLQRWILQRTTYYFGRYVQRDTAFGHARIRTLPAYYSPPIVDGDMISRMLRFAERMNFGERG